MRVFLRLIAIAGLCGSLAQRKLRRLRRMYRCKPVFSGLRNYSSVFYFAGRDQAGLYQLSQPCGGFGVIFVVVCCHHLVIVYLSRVFCGQFKLKRSQLQFKLKYSFSERLVKILFVN